ncbi:MAG: Fe-S-containing protein, partial [Sporomusaceae bacterium]|nr:Fe-S-containing protein [Sporomusaceae bacterium]
KYLRFSEKFLPLVTFASALFLCLYHGLEFLLFPLNLVVIADTLTMTAIIYKISGFLLAFILAWIAGVAVFKAAAALRTKALLTVFSIQFITLLAEQGVLLVQVMMLRRFIPISRELMAIMAPLINHKVWFLYLLLAMTVILPFTLLFQKRPDKPQGSNPAQYRKILITARHKKRWAGAVAICLGLFFLLSTAGMSYAEKQSELVPAIPVKASGSDVQIALEMVEDGHLHRFSYQATNGATVRFIVIKKSGSAYGIGFDACEICGPTGYFERDGQVVCKLCDVVMNKATIGFKGGCNPIPLEYKVADGKIVVPQAALEKEKDRFK